LETVAGVMVFATAPAQKVRVPEQLLRQIKRFHQQVGGTNADLHCFS
jgi:hypothetical protein